METETRGTRNPQNKKPKEVRIMKIDFLNKSIIVTTTELKRSSIPGSKEYYEFLDITAQLPNFQIVRQAKVVRRAHSPSPTYAFMEACLSDNAEGLDDFFHLRQAGCSYFEIKKWFMAKFPAAFDCMAA